MTDQPVTEAHLLFAQALVQLARDHGVSHFRGAIRLGWDRRDDGWSHGDVHIDWAEGRHGDDARIGLRYEATASVPEIAPDGDRVHPMVYASEGNFYELGSRKGKGEKFYARWRHRIEDFPQSREAGLEALSETNRAWIIQRFGE